MAHDFHYLNTLKRKKKQHKALQLSLDSMAKEVATLKATNSYTGKIHALYKAFKRDTIIKLANMKNTVAYYQLKVDGNTSITNCKFTRA